MDAITTERQNKPKSKRNETMKGRGHASERFTPSGVTCKSVPPRVGSKLWTSELFAAVVQPHIRKVTKGVITSGYIVRESLQPQREFMRGCERKPDHTADGFRYVGLRYRTASNQARCHAAAG